MRTVDILQIPIFHQICSNTIIGFQLTGWYPWHEMTLNTYCHGQNYMIYTKHLPPRAQLVTCCGYDKLFSKPNGQTQQVPMLIRHTYIPVIKTYICQFRSTPCHFWDKVWPNHTCTEWPENGPNGQNLLFPLKIYPEVKMFVRFSFCPPFVFGIFDIL